MLRLEKGFSRGKRPAGEAPVQNNGEADEDDNEAPEDARDKGSSEADEEEKKRHLYEYHGHGEDDQNDIDDYE